MRIVSAQFVDGTTVAVATDEGTLFLPWPSRTWQGQLLRAWVAAGNTIAAAAAAPAPTYRQRRAAAYVAELGDEADFTTTVGDVLDAVIKAIYGDAGELDAMKAKIDAIKERFPRDDR